MLKYAWGYLDEDQTYAESQWMPTAPVVRSVTLQRARDAGLDRHVLGYLPATLIEQPPPAYHTPELGTPLPSPPSL